MLSAIAGLRTKLHLMRLSRKIQVQKPGSLMRCFGYIVRINDGPNFYNLYKNIFINRIYYFKTQRNDPLILDCGSNIGMSILYFKHIYSKARIIGFEPDPANFTYLSENVARNRLADVKLIQAALASHGDMLDFYSDGKDSSSLAKHMPGNLPNGWRKYRIPCVQLRNYLTEPVDFLKMDIEGAEWEVLFDSAQRLRQVREMVIEYHHLPGSPPTLHKILELLSCQGFEYLIKSQYDLFIYAKRTD